MNSRTEYLIDNLEHVAELYTYIQTFRIDRNQADLNHAELEVDIDEFVSRINDAEQDLRNTLSRYRSNIWKELTLELNDER